MAGGGRNQLGPIERLVRLLAVLESAGLVGAGQQQLLDVARYGGNHDDQRRALNRELKHLTDAGWDIRNVATWVATPGMSCAPATLGCGSA